MRHRKRLKTMVAGGAVSLGTTASAIAVPEPWNIEALDALHAVRGNDDVVETVENPTADDLTQMEANLGDDEMLVNSMAEWSTKRCLDCMSLCRDCWCQCSCDDSGCEELEKA